MRIREVLLIEKRFNGLYFHIRIYIFVLYNLHMEFVALHFYTFIYEQKKFTF